MVLSTRSKLPPVTVIAPEDVEAEVWPLVVMVLPLTVTVPSETCRVLRREVKVQSVIFDVPSVDMTPSAELLPVKVELSRVRLPLLRTASPLASVVKVELVIVVLLAVDTPRDTLLVTLKIELSMVVFSTPDSAIETLT